MLSLQKLIEEVAEKRGEILDAFCKAYLAEKRIPINKLELVEQRTETGYTWFFRVKRGRPKKSSQLQTLKK